MAIINFGNVKFCGESNTACKLMLNVYTNKILEVFANYNSKHKYDDLTEYKHYNTYLDHKIFPKLENANFELGYKGSWDTKTWVQIDKTPLKQAMLFPDDLEENQCL
jgi:hypothetical protein